MPPGERHVDGNELYDRDANAIVPDAERLAVLSTWRADAEMVGAYDGFVRARTYLHRTVADCSKLDDAVHAHFEVFAIACDEFAYSSTPKYRGRDNFPSRA